MKDTTARLWHGRSAWQAGRSGAVARCLPVWSVLSAAALVSACGTSGEEELHPIYVEHCAGCHEGGVVEQAPDRAALSFMTPNSILRALERGAMLGQGRLLTPSERRTVAEYLSGEQLTVDLTDSLLAANSCQTGMPPAVELFAAPRWNGWAGLANRRWQPGEHARLDASQLDRLALRWAFGFPGAAWVRGQPTVAGGLIFVGSPDGRVYSLDASGGCVHWIYRADAGVRTAVLLADIEVDSEARAVAFFGDARANVYAVDALTGEEIWSVKVEEHPRAVITAAPQLYEGTLYVPVSSKEEPAAQNPAYECCSFRGSVVAISATDGHQLWKTYTIPDAAVERGENAVGATKWGPSGAAVWVTPAIDPQVGALYVATGDSYSAPVSEFSDAIMALDLLSGEILWSRQMTTEDAWNTSCATADRTNCPEEDGPDFDFGASPILEQLPDGQRLLVVGQKSGIVHAVDPDRDGAIIWQAHLGEGGGRGMVIWGPASDGTKVYVALSVTENDPALRGGLYALRLEDGEQVWYTPTPPACEGKARCNSATSAAVTAIPGLVFAGSRDGTLRAYDAQDGSILWSFDTARRYEAVNGVPARGGSLNVAGAVVVDGMVFVNSGYGAGGMAGNVLLALGPDSTTR